MSTPTANQFLTIGKFMQYLMSPSTADGSSYVDGVAGLAGQLETAGLRNSLDAFQPIMDMKVSWQHHGGKRVIIPECARALLAAMKVFERALSRELDDRFSLTSVAGKSVFLGHGQSPAWLDLRSYIQDTLQRECIEYNMSPTAGITTAERLGDMLDASCFAFLIATAEDMHKDGTAHARENVIHETGLFQGRLGYRRAIVMLEHGCEEFSNIRGLGQIRFPTGKIADAFDEVRATLKREGILTEPSA